MFVLEKLEDGSLEVREGSKRIAYNRLATDEAYTDARQYITDCTIDRMSEHQDPGLDLLEKAVALNRAQKLAKHFGWSVDGFVNSGKSVLAEAIIFLERNNGVDKELHMPVSVAESLVAWILRRE